MATEDTRIVLYGGQDGSTDDRIVDHPQHLSTTSIRSRMALSGHGIRSGVSSAASACASTTSW